jgi:hypothetical protein
MNRLLDIGHKVLVSTLMGITLYGLVGTGVLMQRRMQLAKDRKRGLAK